MSYMIGQVQYASSLYWLRATEENKEYIRFLYCRVLAACMGLETSELLSLRQCKIKRVKEKNVRYIRACEYMNMPTLKDLAVKNARNLVRQWGIYDVLRFTWSEDGKHIDGLADNYEDKLCAHAVALSFEDINDWYPQHTKAKSDPIQLGKLEDDKFPHFSQVYKKAIAKVDQIFKSLGSEPEIRDYINCYIIMSRDFFKANEFYHRSSKHLDPVGKIETVRKRKNPAAITQGKKPRLDVCSQPLPVRVVSTPTRTARSPVRVPAPLPSVATPVRPQIRRHWDGGPVCCSMRPPARRGRRTYACRICGYMIPPKMVKKDNKLECCGKLMHIECWNISVDPGKTDSRRCESLRHLLEKDGSVCEVKKKPRTNREVLPVSTFAASQGDRATESTSVICPYCKECVSVIDKDHLRYGCKKVNAVLSRTGLTSSRVFDPGTDDFSKCLSPVATRSAAMTAVARVTGTPGCADEIT